MTEVATKHPYGWHPSLPDLNDIFHAFHTLDVANLPQQVDLRPGCSPILDQGPLGSCTSHMAVEAMWFLEKRQGKMPVLGSPLFHYFVERFIKSEDTGSTIRRAVQVLRQHGVCPESEWPYDPSKFAIKPPQQCYDDAKKEEALVDRRVLQRIDQIQACLASGYPMLFGFTVYESFESDEVARTGIVPMPQKGEQVLGGHAVLAVGYDTSKNVVYVQNSWGPDWGDKGFFYMPFDYIVNPNLASDLWMITSVE